MPVRTTLQTSNSRNSASQWVMLAAGLVLAGAFCSAQSPATGQPATAKIQTARAHHRAKKPAPAPEPVIETPPAPPMPHWPVNDQPTPASVVWDATGLRISAANSSLQQILSEVSTETGTKVEGSVADQRIYGNYGPGQARDVLSQLLQGSGYNVLLAGDLGKGAPREIVLTPREAPGPQNAGANRPQQDPDDEIPEQTEDQPQQPIPPPPVQNNMRPGFGPNGPLRTPQQVMEEMQQRQLQQQQQMQQQQQQNPQP